MNSQTFVIPGVAVPKGRPRTVSTPGGHVRTYTPKKTVDFESDVGWEAKRARVRMHQGIVAVTLRFFGVRRGDADNLAKSVLDGLNGIAFGDDAQVDELHVYVDRVGKPARTEVEISAKGVAA